MHFKGLQICFALLTLNLHTPLKILEILADRAMIIDALRDNERACQMARWPLSSQPTDAGADID